MIRGRLVAVNGRPWPRRLPDERAKRLVDREFNLSTRRAPPHNQIVAGRWTPDEAGAVSVEEGIAKTLGLKLGDRCASTSAASRPRRASPACARWTGARCAPTSS
jgi:putative ABC transport system permease protein